MARKTPQEAQATRNSILNAAVDVFYEEGVARATLEDIAKKAGVTRGAIYWHFKNKTDLFRALHADLHMGIMDMLLERLELSDSTPLEKLEALCVELLIDLQTRPQKRKVLAIFQTKCDYSGDLEPLQQLMSDGKTEGIRVFSRFLAKAQEVGELSASEDPDILATALLCYMTGLTTENLRNPDLLDMKAQAESLIHLFFRGLIRE